MLPELCLEKQSNMAEMWLAAKWQDTDKDPQNSLSC